MSDNKQLESKIFDPFISELFGYLITEYNFSLSSTLKSAKLYRIVFQNKTTAVIVNWDRRENWIYIELYRLINGELVSDPIYIKGNTELNGYYLDDLLSIRHPDYLPEKIPLDDKDIKNVLISYSLMLREHAADVLNGDFTIFRELDKIVKRRIALYNG